VAQLLPPNLPLYLYRYRSLAPKIGDDGRPRPVVTREIEALRTPYLFCAAFETMNDPMEGFYSPSRLLRRRDDYERIAREIYQGKVNVGIVSLSDTKENELMWTHYAGNYSGICIEFYAGRLLSALPDTVDLIRMGYDDVPPRISGQDATSTDAAARKILSQKKFNWAYEREWRILGPLGQVSVNSSDVVKSIYLGSRINGLDRYSILEAFEKSAVDILEMDVDGYKHEWRPVQGPRFAKSKRSHRKNTR